MWYVVRLDSSRVVTRHSSPTPHFDQGCDSTRVKSNYIAPPPYIPHRLYVVEYEPRQRAAFNIPVKSMSFKSFDYRRHRACAIARLVSQPGHINFIPNAPQELSGSGGGGGGEQGLSTSVICLIFPA